MFSSIDDSKEGRAMKATFDVVVDVKRDAEFVGFDIISVLLSTFHQAPSVESNKYKLFTQLIL